MKFVKFSITFFFTVQLQQLLLEAVINCHAKFFGRSAVLQGGRDHI